MSCIICFEEENTIQIPCECQKNSKQRVHIKCLYTWQEQSNGSCPLCRNMLPEVDYRYFDKIGVQIFDKYKSFKREFVSRPVEKTHGIIKCYVKQLPDKTFEFWIQRPTMLSYPKGNLPKITPINGDALLMVSDKNFKIYVNNTPYIIGEVVSSSTGLKHKVNIITPSITKSVMLKQQIAEIGYKSNRIINKGPRKMNFTISSAEKVEDVNIYDRKFFVSKWKMSKTYTIGGKNQKPGWNESANAFTLDFDGRVTKSSNKNCRLVDEKGNYIFQFGKVIKHYDNGYNCHQVYTCDFRWPMSPLQAFGICLSSCRSKPLCC